MPTASKDKSFEEIKEILEVHFKLKPIRAAERYYFRRRLQVPDESIAEYVAELHRFSNLSQLELLRGIISGIGCKRLMRALQSMWPSCIDLAIWRTNCVTS